MFASTRPSESSDDPSASCARAAKCAWRADSAKISADRKPASLEKFLRRRNPCPTRGAGSGSSAALRGKLCAVGDGS